MMKLREIHLNFLLRTGHTPTDLCNCHTPTLYLKEGILSSENATPLAV